MTEEYRKDLSPYTPVVRDAMTHGAHQRPAELDWLLDEVLDTLPFNRVLEIGSESGGTLWLWCQMAYETAQIVAIDNDSEPYCFGDLMEQYPWPAREHQSLLLINDESTSPAALDRVKAFFSGPIDFLFLDGGHSPELIRSDWGMYSPLVAEGGFVAFHDIANHPALGITAFWEECIKPHYETEEFVDPNDPGMGIGLVYL